MGRSPVAFWASVVAIVTCGACESTSGSVKEFYFVALGKNPVGRFVQATRPTACQGATQPAIVDFEAGRMPVWGCLPACKPGSEYVTDTLASSDPQYTTGTQLDARCHAVCGASEHRLSYADFDHNARCAPGAPPPNEAQALALEQQRISLLHDQALDAALAPIEARMSKIEALPRPWSEDSLLESHRVVNELSDVHQWYDEARYKALEARLRALDSVSRIAAKAMKSRLRAKESSELCRSSCERKLAACTRACAHMQPSACDTCQIDNRDCNARCS
jgi:hypothetical protein